MSFINDALYEFKAAFVQFATAWVEQNPMQKPKQKLRLFTCDSQFMTPEKRWEEHESLANKGFNTHCKVVLEPEVLKRCLDSY